MRATASSGEAGTPSNSHPRLTGTALAYGDTGGPTACSATYANTATDAPRATAPSSRGRALTLLVGACAVVAALSAVAVHASSDVPQARHHRPGPTHGVTRAYESTEETPNTDVGTGGDHV